MKGRDIEKEDHKRLTWFNPNGVQKLKGHYNFSYIHFDR